MPQTLPKQNRRHPAITKTHDREISLSSNTLLVTDIFKVGDGSAFGFVGIKDISEIYDFSNKVFFKESDVKITTDFKLINKPDSILGYVEVDKVSINLSKINLKKPKKVISLAEKKRRDFHNSLTPDEKEMIHMFYKMRVVGMERKQGTTVLETCLLDKVEYMKSKFGTKFNHKNYMKGIAKKYKFKFEKLNSGYLKRVACKRWAKNDFLKKVRKVE
jgi:hypothetical protein